MKFAIIHSTQAAMPITNFGSCQAVRKIAELPKIVDRVEVTPEWLADNEAKNFSYVLGRKNWQSEHEKAELEAIGDAAVLNRRS